MHMSSSEHCYVLSLSFFFDLKRSYGSTSESIFFANLVDAILDDALCFGPSCHAIKKPIVWGIMIENLQPLAAKV